ncbi:transglutaminase [Sporosarcina sp. P16a]|uniref:transglutaminase-like domain-containing protein n=1 Tax=unclassified Sporosarcina TaxID=2647733 RepID=UPI000C170424|nr:MULTISPECIES: transglutaminase-like domain-containing protein [unclassified Sporosarcina]PIC67362.1 transglutaminase [Sporosarcina sp. P16a]PIC92813.1 transglutaminase [Sporosarcina sp. P25]
MKKPIVSWKVLMFLYALSVVLLWEWFIPIMDLTDFGHPSLFIIYLILFFALALFRLSWWVGGVIQILYVLWAIHYMYFDQLWISIETTGYILQDVQRNILLLIKGDLGELSNLFRTLLLFTLVWMIAYLLRHWIEVRRSMMMFFSFTIVFVALLDTFTPYDATSSIVRIMIVGLLIVSCLTLIKLSGDEGLSLRPKRLLLLSLPVILIVVSVGLLSRNAPVYPPAWPDPVPFLLSLSGVEEKGSDKGQARAGYDPDDSQLGGAFVQDSQLVFEASVEQRQYWRIETKDTYTSKGWIQDKESNKELLFTGEDLWAPVVEGEVSLATLDFTEPLPFLATPYGTTKISSPEGFDLMHEMTANRLYLLMGLQEKIEQYEMEFVEPTYTMSDLQKAEMVNYETVQEDLESYLQLPDELPERVKELALSITENETAVYDKVKAVEQYFKKNGFVYETQNVPVPDEDQDYVDQFLFDTKKGYCDNFSTSMAVMLRSANIPTRWVKGFAPGEMAFKASGKNVYRVTNDEAHSWVEAYIPEIGWMPFEPTIGFTHPTEIEFDISNESPEQEEIKKAEKPEVEKEKELPKKTKGSPAFDAFKQKFAWLFSQWWLYASLLVLIVGTCVVLYSKRSNWLPKWRIKQLRKLPNGRVKFEQQFAQLLQQLARTGLPKDTAMTLTNYAILVDGRYGGDRMTTLTRAYEMGIYGNNWQSQDWDKLNEVWEDLIISTTC